MRARCLGGVGWRALAAEIETARVKTGARCVLAQSYAVASWLSFYLPAGTCVVQRFERIRWINGPQPGADQLMGQLLYVDDGSDNWTRAARYFNRIDTAAVMVRKRGSLVIETFDLVVEPTKGSARQCHDIVSFPVTSAPEIRRPMLRSARRCGTIRA